MKRKTIAMILILFMCFSLIGQSEKANAMGEIDVSIANPRVEYNTRDTLEFGHYLQEDTNSDGIVDEEDEKQPIKWQILSRNGDDLFLLADKLLDCQEYNDSNDTSVTWETCTLRKWMNDDFFNTAFSASEQKGIMTTTVVNTDNSEYGTKGGNNTNDKIYLLSADEAANSSYGFLSTEEGDQVRHCEATSYAIKQDLFIHKDGGSGWWLRSPGHYSDYAAVVSRGGFVNLSGSYVNYKREYAVRPVLHLNLSALLQLDYKMCEKKNVSIKSSTYDLVELGSYRGKNIQWRVLSMDGNDVFLLADKYIDNKEYNEEKSDVTWETCTLRKWLNDVFFNTAFSENEKNAIVKTKYESIDSLDGIDGGNDTEDKVTLLSMSDIVNQSYGFPTISCVSETRVVKSLEATDTSQKDSRWWWLRSPGIFSDYAAYVYDAGYVDWTGFSVAYDAFAVRPALHLDLSTLYSLKAVGTVVASEDGTQYYDTEGKQIGVDESTSTPETTATAEPTKRPEATATVAPRCTPEATATVAPTKKTEAAATVTVTKPSEVKVFKAKAVKGKLKLSWNKVVGATGYEILYSLKSNFKKSRKVTIANASTKTKTITGLKKKKKYYVRIRAYKKDGSKKVYSAWKKTSKKTK